MKNKNIANTYNFFEIREQNVVFWGLDVQPKSVSLTKRAIKLIRELNLPLHEVVEIYDDETLNFFQETYY